LLNIKTPARLWIGGWYDNYEIVGGIDEVCLSRVASSADQIRLEYENQSSIQTLVCSLVQSGNVFSVSETRIELAEGKAVTLTANAGGVQKFYWLVKRDGKKKVVATNRSSFTFDAGRVVGDQSLTLQFQAI
jgi:hypothetical protein